MNTSAPALKGTPRDGSTLYSGKGTWQGSPTITYAVRWQLCDSAGESCSDIAGANKFGYRLVHEDVGRRLRAVVTATNGEGSEGATSAASPLITKLKPSKAKAPAIAGVAQDGKLLSAGTGTWKRTPPFSYAYRLVGVPRKNVHADRGRDGIHIPRRNSRDRQADQGHGHREQRSRFGLEHLIGDQRNSWPGPRSTSRRR